VTKRRKISNARHFERAFAEACQRQSALKQAAGLIRRHQRLTRMDPQFV
jgi:hypothetical protein